MLRKFLNINYIESRLGSFRSFWRLRYRLKKLDFERLKLRRKVREDTGNVKSDVNMAWFVSKSSIPAVLIAALVALLLYLFNIHIDYFKQFDWIQRVASWVNVDDDAYKQMLVAIPSVIGVLMGLYFTAVSNVLSDAYDLLTKDLRQLILKHTVANGYIKFVAFLMALSLILLGFASIGIEPLHLAIPILVLMTASAIFSFIWLFIGAFNLSDPTSLIDPLYSDFAKWVRLATSKGKDWQDKSFQQFYRRKAYEVLDTMASIARLAKDREQLKVESYPRMLRKLLLLVRAYYKEKPLIPSDSNWFGKKYQHKQWYLSDSTDLDMATRTNTSLTPSEVPDTTWVEDLILNMFFDAIHADSKKGNYESLYAKLTDLPDFLMGISNKWFVGESKEWNLKLVDEIIKDLAASTIDTDSERLNSIGVTDILSSLPSSIEIGFIKAVNGLDIERMRSELLRSKWQKPESPYKFSVPLDAIKILEQIHEGVVFEKSSKSIYITKNWYVVERVFNNIDWFMFNQWSSLMELFESYYITTGKRLADSGKFTHSASVYSRAIEQAWKLDNHIEQLKSTSEMLRKDAKLAFKKPQWDWDKEHRRVLELRNTVIDAMAELIPKLLTDKQPGSDIPDFFGGAVHFVGEDCYDALASDDTDRFKHLFRLYFLGILGIFDRVIPQVKDWDIDTAFTWLSEPMIDLINISGYAYIFAEYYNKPGLWNDCKVVWDTYLSNAPQQLQPLAAIINHSKNRFATITPRDSLRSRWAITLANMLNDLPRQSSSGTFSQPSVSHSSELIRNIAPFDGSTPFMTYDAVDVFVVKYFLERQDATSLDFGIRHDVIEGINRQRGGSDD